jgi:hypothetical protein
MRDLSLALGNDPSLINSSNFYVYYDNLVCLQYAGKEVPSLFSSSS